MRAIRITLFSCALVRGGKHGLASVGAEKGTYLKFPPWSPPHPHRIWPL